MWAAASGAGGAGGAAGNASGTLTDRGRHEAPGGAGLGRSEAVLAAAEEAFLAAALAASLPDDELTSFLFDAKVLHGVFMHRIIKCPFNFQQLVRLGEGNSKVAAATCSRIRLRSLLVWHFSMFCSAVVG